MKSKTRGQAFQDLGSVLHLVGIIMKSPKWKTSNEIIKNIY